MATDITIMLGLIISGSAIEFRAFTLLNYACISLRRYPETRDSVWALYDVFWEQRRRQRIWLYTEDDLCLRTTSLFCGDLGRLILTIHLVHENPIMVCRHRVGKKNIKIKTEKKHAIDSDFVICYLKYQSWPFTLFFF